MLAATTRKNARRYVRRLVRSRASKSCQAPANSAAKPGIQASTIAVGNRRSRFASCTPSPNTATPWRPSGLARRKYISMRRKINKSSSTRSPTEYTDGSTAPVPTSVSSFRVTLVVRPAIRLTTTTSVAPISSDATVT